MFAFEIHYFSLNSLNSPPNIPNFRSLFPRDIQEIPLIPTKSATET